MDEAQWNALGDVYEQLPGFIGYSDGIPYWFGMEPDESNQEPDILAAYLWASVEPSGLLISGYLQLEDWLQWQEVFVSSATAAVGFLVKPAEEDS